MTNDVSENALNFEEEVSKTVDEIKYAVKSAESLNNSKMEIVLNEGHQFILQLTSRGFEIVEYKLAQHQTSICDLEKGTKQVYETVYSFLDYFSPSYRNCFVSKLSGELLRLQEEQV